MNGTPILLRVTTTALTGHLPYVLFESPDCSGPPLIEASAGLSASPITLVAVTAPGHTVYVPDRSVASQSRTINSIFLGGTCNSGGDIGAPFQSQVIPASAVVNLDQFFSAPFDVK